MAQVEHYFEIPELRNETVLCTDWRMGKRLAVVHPGFVSFPAAVVVVLAFFMLIIGLGAAWGGIFGDFARTFTFTIRIAIGVGMAFALLFLLVNFYFPGSGNVIDWQAGSIRCRKGRRWRTYALSDLSKITIVQDRLNDNLTTASVKMMVAGELLELLSSKGCVAFDEACGKVVAWRADDRS